MKKGDYDRDNTCSIEMLETEAFRVGITFLEEDMKTILSKYTSNSRVLFKDVLRDLKLGTANGHLQWQFGVHEKPKLSLTGMKKMNMTEASIKRTPQVRVQRLRNARSRKTSLNNSIHM